MSRPQNSGPKTRTGAPGTDSGGGACLRLYFRVPRPQIGYVRFVVEAYDGLAQVTSRPGRGEVEWVVPPGLEREAERLARALEREVGLTPIPRPQDWEE